MITEIIPYFGYCFAFMGQCTAFSDYFAKEAAVCGKLLCAKVDDKFAGYICTAGNGRENRVTYAYTRPEYRGQGIFTALLKEIAESSEMTEVIGTVLPDSKNSDGINAPPRWQ